MLKILTLSSLVLALLSSVALAGPVYYKGEKPYYSQVHYKGEAPPIYKAAAVSTSDSIPCITFAFNSGPYLGLNPGLVTNYSQKAYATYKGFEGTIFAGYAFVGSSFYLAPEIFFQRDAQIQNYTNMVNNNGNPIGLRATYGGGLSLLPGYIVADTILLYLRVGTVTTHFQDVAKTKTGGQAGIGLEGAVSENWTLRAEYDYSFYPSISLLGNIRSDAYRIGLMYRFS